jgi:hypothetical protein
MLALLAAFIVVPSTPVLGQEPQTVTAIGTGETRPDPSDRNDNDAIRRAVDAARREVVPLAISAARARAVEIAAAGGLASEPSSRSPRRS